MQNQIVTFLGRKGSGKSTLVRESAREWPRVIYFDTLGDYAGEGEELEDLRSVTEALIRVRERKRFALVLRLIEENDALEALELTYHLGNCLVVLEEAPLYMPHQRMPLEIAQLVRYGRHAGVSQFYVARRASELPRDVTANSDLVVSFQQREPRDVAYLNQLEHGAGDQAQQLDYRRFEILTVGDLDQAPLAVLERLEGQGEINRGVARTERTLRRLTAYRRRRESQ